MERAKLDAIEAALDAGALWALISENRYWNCRRNGKTRHSKTQPSKFVLPVKVGFRTTGQIDEYTFIFPNDTPVSIAVANRASFVICDINPLEQIKNERSNSTVDAAT